MRLLVSSAKGANGAGYGAILAFDFAGNASGPFYVNNGNKRVLALDQKGQVLKTPARSTPSIPGGGVFGPDGRYYVGSRRLRTIMAMPARLDGPAIPFLPPDVVPFPRGFAFAPDDRIFLA